MKHSVAYLKMAGGLLEFHGQASQCIGGVLSLVPIQTNSHPNTIDRILNTEVVHVYRKRLIFRGNGQK